MGSPRATHAPPAKRARPVEARAPARARSARARRASGVADTVPSGSYPAPETVAVPEGVQAATTAISLQVSVPVLSVQMNVVDPSVSTDSRWRTSAWRAAIRWAPSASESVTVGRRPSGTRATVTPTAKRNPLRAPKPKSQAIRKNADPTASATAATTRTTRSSSIVSGLFGRTACWARSAMPASLVRAPVAVTTARPSPSTAKVPARTASPAATHWATLSPVTIDRSTASPWLATTRRSAEMRSPASIATRSPTTRSAASMSAGRPSRTTVARRGSIERSRAAAWPARRSWAKAKTPFTTTTTTIATASCGIPPTAASAAATHNRRAKKCVSWPRRCRHGAGWRAVGSSLGPSRARRAAASAAVSPEPGEPGSITSPGPVMPTSEPDTLAGR